MVSHWCVFSNILGVAVVYPSKTIKSTVVSFAFPWGIKTLKTYWLSWCLPVLWRLIHGILLCLHEPLCDIVFFLFFLPIIAEEYCIRDLAIARDLIGKYFTHCFCTNDYHFIVFLLVFQIHFLFLVLMFCNSICRQLDVWIPIFFHSLVIKLH